jgi:hypothetical protein
VAFYGFAGYLIARATRRWNRRVNIAFATIILITAIGFSRIYLGEHYLSDIWSGYLVGAMWLIIAVCLSEWFRQRATGNRSVSPVVGALPLSFVFALIAVLFYAGFAISYHPPPASVQSKKVVVVQKSTDIFTSEKMKYTDTLTGEKQEPINFIFLAEDDGRLKTAMQKAGWTLTDKADISSFIKAIKALMLRKPHPSAPIAPSFWNSKIQNMGFAEVAGPNWLSNAHHLKIWRTHFKLPDGNTIYVGMANANHGLKWGIFPKINPDLDAARDLLYRDLARTGKIKGHFEIQLVKPETGEDFLGERFFTDGKAFIISLAG